MGEQETYMQYTTEPQRTYTCLRRNCLLCPRFDDSLRTCCYRIEFVTSSSLQFVYLYRSRHTVDLPVSLEIPLSQQRSSFNQMSDVFSRGRDPITHAHSAR